MISEMSGAAMKLGSTLTIPFQPRLVRPRELALRIGFDMHFDVPGPHPTAMIFMLYCHPDAAGTLDRPEQLVLDPGFPVEHFTDFFGNRSARVVMPGPGVLKVSHDAIFRCAYEPEPQPDATTRQHEPGDLPVNALPFLLGSRYCEVDRLSAVAWDLFGKTPPGYARVQAVNDWVHRAIEFGYRHARPNKTALDVYTERRGVCRDYMHLAITFCRALGIPARYATGYLSDINAAPDPTPMDFSAFYEVYLDNQWWPFDARYGVPRIGRILMARGRDAVDVALTTSFGPTRLLKFKVTTEEANPAPAQQQQTLQIHEAPHPVPQAIAV